MSSLRLETLSVGNLIIMGNHEQIFAIIFSPAKFNRIAVARRVQSTLANFDKYNRKYRMIPLFPIKYYLHVA